MPERRDAGELPDEENQPLLDQHVVSAEDGVESIQPDAEFGGPEERKKLEKSLLRKLDGRMSILIVIYILNYIDRNNASAARLRGFEKDLHLEGSQFATILSVLYVGYILMQIPSNMYLSSVGRPSVYLPSCMVIWGLLSIATGFTTNFLGALVTRFFLGFVEAAFFPGALFLISKWYKRNELSQRTALLSVGSLISNAFGSLIASGILDTMEGRLGYSAWRWLFFVEGALTVFVATCAVFILPDFPETSCSWLTPAELALARRRILEDAGPNLRHSLFDGKVKQSPWSGLRLAVKDWKVWWLAVTLTAMAVSLSFHAYFPTLCGTMGYNPTLTLLLCVPPWIFATFVALFVSRRSDELGERCLHIVVPIYVGLLGFVMSIVTMNIVVRYISLFLMAQSYAGFICFLAWTSSSVSHPPEKRAVALALINCVSQLGNVAGSYMWPSAWGPSYNKSYTICIATSALTVVLCFHFRRHLESLNADAERFEVERGTNKGSRYML
ncbi:MFS general substrate transporter [Crucibulum laeve]|uniref:MFS general substrate transporter n=1 Tax=Crucibulum laeve TaxID=68775 RepID=A0A5C3MF86_9AGAR|nr:MFS general substrate transporter [Crucibulum laeve]